MKTIKTTVNSFDDLKKLSNIYDFIIDKTNSVVYLLRDDCHTDDCSGCWAYVAYTKSTLGGSEHPTYHLDMRGRFSGVWSVYARSDFDTVMTREKEPITDDDIAYVTRINKRRL